MPKSGVSDEIVIEAADGWCHEHAVEETFRDVEVAVLSAVVKADRKRGPGWLVAHRRDARRGHRDVLHERDPEGGKFLGAPGRVKLRNKTKPGRPQVNEKKLTRIAGKIRQALRARDVTHIGLTTGFTQRLREVTPHRLALSLISAMASQRVETIADLQRGFNNLCNSSVHYKPFHNQLAKPSFPRFMEGVFRRLLEEMVLKVIKPLPKSSLRQFDDIVIQDGSSFAIKESLREHFPGRFTTISPAAVEIHATMSVVHDQVIRVSVAPDSQGERDFLPEAKTLAKKLLLADRGYEDIGYCSRIEQANGSFLVRFKSQMNPIVVEARTGDKRQRQLEGKKFQEVLASLRKKNADVEVQWKRKRQGQVFRARVAVLWNKQTEEHALLVTNLERSDFDLAAIATLYRLRWQVELLFKEWKSYANLHAFDTSKAPIAEGLIWAGLAAALLKRFLAHAVEYVFGTVGISTRRSSMALPCHLPRLLQRLLGGGGFERVLAQLLAFLETNGRRAHPKRDREKGRLKAGLRHAMLRTPSA